MVVLGPACLLSFMETVVKGTRSQKLETFAESVRPGSREVCFKEEPERHNLKTDRRQKFGVACRLSH